MVAGEADPDVAHAAIDVLVEPGEEAVEIDVDGVDHGALLGGVRPDCMTKDVGRGNADGEDIGDVVAAHLLGGYERLCEVEQVGDGGGRLAYIIVEMARFCICLADGLGGAIAVVEGLGPCR